MITQRFLKPGRLAAAAHLASQQVPPDPMPLRDSNYREGLSAGISGTAYGDAVSISSVASSEAGADENPYTGLGKDGAQNASQV